MNKKQKKLTGSDYVVVHSKTLRRECNHSQPVKQPTPHAPPEPQKSTQRQTHLCMFETKKQSDSPWFNGPETNSTSTHRKQGLV